MQENQSKTPHKLRASSTNDTSWLDQKVCWKNLQVFYRREMKVMNKGGKNAIFQAWKADQN